MGNHYDMGNLMMLSCMLGLSALDGSLAGGVGFGCPTPDRTAGGQPSAGRREACSPYVSLGILVVWKLGNLPAGAVTSLRSGRDSKRPSNVYATVQSASRDSSGVEHLTVDQVARVQFPFPVPGLRISFPFRELKTLERSQA